MLKVLKACAVTIMHGKAFSNGKAVKNNKARQRIVKEGGRKGILYAGYFTFSGKIALGLRFRLIIARKKYIIVYG